MQRVITKLEVNARRPNRVKVYLDGVAELQVMKLIALKLHVGQAVSSDEIEELKQQDLEEQMYQQALGLFSHRPRSEEELRQRFRQKHYSHALQEKVIDRLRQANYLDDLAFAKAWIENRNEFRPRSAWALKSELRKKGISRETIDEALYSFDDSEAVAKAASIGARKYKSLDEQLFRKRLGAYLARRGFQYHLILPAVDQEWELLAGREESEVTK